MHLPQELVTSMLVRLPAKSLSRFKCVCKAWQAIIDDPSFMNQRLKTMNGVSSNDDLFLINTCWPPSIVACRLLSGECTEIMDMNGAPCIIYEQINGAQINEIPELVSTISEPINGVYCIMTRPSWGSPAHSIMVWNPGNGQVHILPPIPRPVLPDDNINFEYIYTYYMTYDRPPSYDYTFDDLKLDGFYCGFGYDPSSNDYKFVCISEYGAKFGVEHFALFHVYSLGSNSWHQLDPHQIAYPDLITLNAHGRARFEPVIFGNYAYPFGNECHWWDWDCGIDDTYMVSFDFVNHVFRVTCVPKTVLEGRPNTLTSVDGSLAVVSRVVHDNGTSIFNIGVMKDQSWTLAYKITLNTACTFLAIVEDEFFVQEDDGWVVSYSVGDHQQEGRDYCYVPPYSNLLPFKGSLVPVKPRMENNDQN